jgi:hypothetical protein
MRLGSLSHEHRALQLAAQEFAPALQLAAERTGGGNRIASGGAGFESGDFMSSLALRIPTPFSSPPIRCLSARACQKEAGL